MLEYYYWQSEQLLKLFSWCLFFTWIKIGKKMYFLGLDAFYEAALSPLMHINVYRRVYTRSAEWCICLGDLLGVSHYICIQGWSQFLFSPFFWYQKIFVNNLFRPNTISQNRQKGKNTRKEERCGKKNLGEINRMLAFGSPIIIIPIEVVTIIATLGVIHLSGCPQDNVSIQ